MYQVVVQKQYILNAVSSGPQLGPTKIRTRFHELMRRPLTICAKFRLL